MNRKSLFSSGSLVLLGLLFIALVMLSGLVLKGWRVDLTENRQYTLSEGTYRVLENMQEPVTLYFFFSQEASGELPQVRSYARWIGEMLDDMADRSGGKLEIRTIDPEPFSREEDEAARFGLQSVPVGTVGDPLYFGLAGTNSLDDVQIIPFLNPAKQPLVEYDIAKLVASLSHPEPLKVGLLSSLDLEPGFDMATQEPRPAWVIYDQLEQLFEVVDVSNDAAQFPDDLDLLMVIHPKALSEAMQYRIDQFVLSGGRLVAFLDPFAEADLGDDPSDPMARLNAGSSSNLEPLLASWGVEYDPLEVVGDQLYALQVNSQASSRPIRHLAILAVGRDGMNESDIVSADLEAVNVSSAGWFMPAGDATTTFTPLLTTSDNAGPIEASRLRFLANPADLQAGFEATGEHYAVAARLEGPASAAFGQAPDGVDPDGYRSEAVPGGINVILFADTDLLTDRMWVSQQSFFGQIVSNAFADNGTLVVNAVDNLLGTDDLISIRTRATSARPFDRVEALRLEAEGQYRATEERLNAELAETERTLADMQANRGGGDLGILDEDQAEEIQRFLDRRTAIRQELRDVQHELNKDIEALGTRLTLLNLLVVPVAIVIFALLAGQARRRRRLEARR
jgi:ABC-type uncharacterized transport system involved in gliding motility auxiliary subunit